MSLPLSRTQKMMTITAGPDLPWWRPLYPELVEAHDPSEIFLFFEIGSQNTKIFLPENSEDLFLVPESGRNLLT